MTELNGKIAVLGATGFVGSRLIERLVCEQQTQITALVRTLQRAVKIARYPIELIHGEVLDQDALDRAMMGCDIVFDCTFPATGALKERCGTAESMVEAVATAAARNKVRRIVHLSTVSVYGPAEDGDLCETSPRKAENDPYGASKLAAEQAWLRLHESQDTPVVVLQPTVIYGPDAGWTAGVMQQLSKGRFALVDGGQGYCNAVYVDDVIEAMFRAALVDGVEGECFLISGNEPVLCGDYYGALEVILGEKCTLAMSRKEIDELIRKSMRDNKPMRRFYRELKNDAALRQKMLALPVIAQLKGAAQFLLPPSRWDDAKNRMLEINHADGGDADKPLLLPTASQLDLFGAKQYVRIEKARDHLEYAPKYDLKSGMIRCEQWARWAGLAA